MSVRIGINGFGRIGRMLTRAVYANPRGVTIAAINDLAPPDHLAYGLRRDSTRGPFPAEVASRNSRLLVDGHVIPCFQQVQPEDIPWEADAGVEVVIEATGKFRSGKAARRHIEVGGARKVVISASADHPDATLVVGVNDHTYDPAEHDVVSPASCGVNALAVMASALDARWGLREVSTTVVLALQGWQRGHDSLVGTSRDDPRLGRAAASSIIPHDHVAGELLTQVLPQIGETTSDFYCVPTQIGSLACLAGQLDQPASAELINKTMADCADGPLHGVLGYDHDLSVSVDVTGNPVSVLFDPTGTRVTSSGRVAVRGWFDGEWGFAHRLLDLARLVAAPATPSRGQEPGPRACSSLVAE